MKVALATYAGASPSAKRESAMKANGFFENLLRGQREQKSIAACILSIAEGDFVGDPLGVFRQAGKGLVEFPRGATSGRSPSFPRLPSEAPRSQRGILLIPCL